MSRAKGKLTEHVGVPVDRETKKKLSDIAKKLERSHTEVARKYIVEGVERDEKEVLATAGAK